MRNLKRALSLALASVMLLGMMVVGTSAASYPDVDDNDNTEAIEVLNAVGVMIGNTAGNFEPDKNVTRNEMAAVIARLLLGAEAETYIGAHPFTDVPSWAQKYVAACYDNGIVTGRSATIYDGNSTVTAQEAATMMLRVLGYEQITGTGADWAKPVVAKANQIRLFKGVTGSATAPMNRNDVAQLALNALEADMVETDVNPYYNGTGVSYQVSYELRKDLNNAANAAGGGNTGYNYTKDSGNTHQSEYLQLCEELYDGKLTKVTAYDDFGRPATKWAYKGAEVNKYAQDADLTYLKEVKVSDIYKDLGLSSDIAAGKVLFTIDGVDDTAASRVYSSDTTPVDLNGVTITKNGGDKNVKIGGKGAVTQVYYNADATTQVRVCVTNYYLAKATENYDTKDEDVNVIIYDDVVASATLKNDDVAVSNVQKDDYLVVTIANGIVKTAAPATVVENVPVTSARGDDYVIAGQKYEYSDISEKTANALGKSLMNTPTGYDLKDSGYNLYLDPNGYVLGVVGYDGGVNMSNYLFVKEIGNGGFTSDAIAKVVFSDGTTKTINVTKIDDADANTSSNFRPANEAEKFYKFTVSGDNYKLTTVASSSGAGVKVIQAHAGTNSDGKTLDTATNGAITPIQGVTTQYADDSTLFLAKDKVTTGVKNAPKVAKGTGTTQNVIHYLYGNEADNLNRLLWVYATNTGSVVTSIEDLVYILEQKTAVNKDDNNNTYYTYIVWKNGEKVDMDANDTGRAAGLYKVDTYTNDRADLPASPITSDNAEFITASNVSSYKFENSVLAVGGKGSYYLNSDAKVYTIDGTTVKDVQPSTLGARTIADGFKNVILVKEKNETNANIAVVYVIKASGVKAVATASASPSVATVTATSSVAGQSVDLTGKTEDNKMAAVKTALNVTAVTNVWDISDGANGAIVLTAKNAGAIGSGSAPASAPAGFGAATTEGKDAVVAAKASASVTLASGESVTAGGVTIAYDTLNGGGDKADQAAGSDMTYSWNYTSKAVTLTAKNEGAAGNNLEYTDKAGQTAKLAGGKDAASAVAAVYTLEKADVKLAGKTITFDSKTYNVTGDTLTAQMQAWADAYNADSGNTVWTASVGAGDLFVFTAKTAGGSPSAPTGTTITTPASNW